MVYLHVDSIGDTQDWHTFRHAVIFVKISGSLAFFFFFGFSNNNYEHPNPSKLDRKIILHEQSTQSTR